MTTGNDGRILVSTTGLDPAQWVGEFRRLTERSVVTEPD
jgi:hypothetical protein